MGQLSLLQSTPSAWPVRAGAISIGATTGGRFATKTSDYTVRILAELAQFVDGGAPLTGDTITLDDDSFSKFLLIEPAGTIATLTVDLPTAANAEVGQEVSITSTQEVTALTLGNLIAGYAVPTTITANSGFTIYHIGGGEWARKF